MTATPTAEAFLSTPYPDEPDEEVHELAPAPPWPTTPAEASGGDPLESIAQSLWVIAGALTEGGVTAADESKQALDQLDAEYAELERLHDAKQQLIEDTLKICKPSTSKLANSIRALLEVPVTAPAEPEGGDEDELVQPAHDAPVEAWRAYAKTKLDVEHEQYTFIDQANRSQIRTMLGISQTEGGA